MLAAADAYRVWAVAARGSCRPSDPIVDRCADIRRATLSHESYVSRMRLERGEEVSRCWFHSADSETLVWANS